MDVELNVKPMICKHSRRKQEGNLCDLGLGKGILAIAKALAIISTERPD